MSIPEIQKLRQRLEEGEEELRSEEEKIKETIDNETKIFFSRFDRKSMDESIENEFRESLENIFRDRINKKRSLLNEISNKIRRIENEFFKECA